MTLSQAAKARLLLAGIFIAMLAGMFGKAYYDVLVKHLTLSFEMFVLPIVVSPMICVIYSMVRGTEPLPALILSFQNGFFWQDIFTGLRPTTGVI